MKSILIILSCFMPFVLFAQVPDSIYKNKDGKLIVERVFLLPKTESDSILKARAYRWLLASDNKNKTTREMNAGGGLKEQQILLAARSYNLSNENKAENLLDYIRCAISLELKPDKCRLRIYDFYYYKIGAFSAKKLDIDKLFFDYKKSDVRDKSPEKVYNTVQYVVNDVFNTFEKDINGGDDF